MARTLNESISVAHFAHPGPEFSTGGTSNASVRMDDHVQHCGACQSALNVPSPQPECICRLCPDGLAFLIAALTPCGAMAARVEMGGAQ